ncbi:MAG: outer membrane beta-barrel protein [Bacteroidota bacterium]
MKKILIITIIFFGGIFTANAQYNSFWSINWQMSQGTGTVSEYIGEFNSRGFEIEGRYFINPKIAIGGKFAWSGLYEQKERDTYKYNENLSVNSVQRRYLYSMPLMVNAAWFPMEYDQENKLYPYLSLGVGTVWTEQETDNGLYYTNKDQWSFAVNPEIGLIIKIMDNLGLNLKAGYTWGTFKSMEGSVDGKLPTIEDYGMLNYSVGMTFMY